MKVDDIRNVGIVGHGGVGKTILAEAMAFNAGVTNRIGSIEDGSTISDFHEQEINRQISISTSMLHFKWLDHKINAIDTPGYLDFVGEVYGAMHVVDIALVMVDATCGIEVGTELVWQYGREHDLSKIIVFNKMDKDNINFSKLCEDMMENFGPNVVVAQLPYNPGPDFDSIIDLLRCKMLVFAADGSYSEEPIPDDFKETFNTYRVKFMESIIEHDDQLMNKYLDDQEISEDELKKALSYATKHNEIYPILCASASKNVGVTRIMEVLVKYGASAEDLPDIHGTDSDGNDVRRKCSKDEPLSVQIFKTISEPHVGELSFVKVFSGILKSGSDVYNANTRETERIAGLYLLNGKDRKDVPQLETGDMGAIIKLKHSHTNDTLCDAHYPLIIDAIEFPAPVIHTAMKPKNQGEEDKVGLGLSALHQEDPTFHHHYDPELKQTIVSGQGEMQLDIVVHRLKRRFNVEVELSEPRIPYRETIRKKVSVHKRYKKQTGGRGQYGDVHLEIFPKPRGEGFEFVNNIVGGVIPGKFIPAVEKGVKNSMVEGFLVGCQMVDVGVRLYDGSYHAVDSSDMAFQVAGSQAMKEAVPKADPIILEPIYEIVVRLPEEFMGTVIGDLSGRRGKVLGMEAEGHFQEIKAEVPLAELYRYSTHLRSMTQGRGRHRRKFSHYEPVPRDVQAKLIEAFASSDH